MTPEKKIIRFQYIKNILFTIAIVVAGIIVYIGLQDPLSLLVIGIVVAYFVFSSVMLWLNVKRNKIFSVYAVCVEKENSFPKNSPKSIVFKNDRCTHTFTASSEDNDGTSVSFTIKTKNFTFDEGATYCILFNKTTNMEISENTLVSFMKMPTEAATFSINDDDAEKVQNETNNDEVAEAEEPVAMNGVIYSEADTMSIDEIVAFGQKNLVEEENNSDEKSNLIPFEKRKE